jgi:hypothetical protein
VARRADTATWGDGSAHTKVSVVKGPDHRCPTCGSVERSNEGIGVGACGRTYLDESAAAAVLGLTARTLANWRSAGRGPRYLKAGGRVRYLRDDLDRWLDSHAHEPEAPVRRRGRAA